MKNIHLESQVSSAEHWTKKGDVDLFLDEDINYSERLEAAGIGIQLEIFKCGFHAFEFLVPSAKISKLARATHSSAISAALFD